MRLRDLKWLVEAPAAPLAVTVKLRARETPRAAIVHATATGATLQLSEPALAAPGQAAVFYRESRILGGGFITS